MFVVVLIFSNIEERKTSWLPRIFVVVIFNNIEEQSRGTRHFLLLQIYSLNFEFYQLQATNTKTGRPAQWALATWAPEGPVSSTCQ